MWTRPGLASTIFCGMKTSRREEFLSSGARRGPASCNPPRETEGSSHALSCRHCAAWRFAGQLCVRQATSTQRRSQSQGCRSGGEIGMDRQGRPLRDVPGDGSQRRVLPDGCQGSGPGCAASGHAASLRGAGPLHADRAGRGEASGGLRCALAAWHGGFAAKQQGDFGGNHGHAQIAPRPLRLTDARAPLTHGITVRDEFGAERSISIPAERALTVFVDKRELVTLMTLGSAPELLVLGYLRNQRLVESVADLDSITVDWDVNAAAVKTRYGIERFDEKTAKRVVTTGCG